MQSSNFHTLHFHNKQVLSLKKKKESSFFNWKTFVVMYQYPPKDQLKSNSPRVQTYSHNQFHSLLKVQHNISTPINETIILGRKITITIII
ncbi:Uncharacterized protein TCM_035707 [Theobroma cacao]|uniref:Uncharacterized protein n=1 Tax=Theobroma cacao TaxID=3641 RepID=A0A061FIT9_THECC|nr:Uncharacterized protein TCM_035707 [Theobroma cacao]